MQVRLTTTISTIIEVNEGVSYEEAKGEIFSRYNEDSSPEDAVEDVQAAQSGSVVFDTVIATEVTHSFEEVK